jgi:hypothetical protein
MDQNLNLGAILFLSLARRPQPHAIIQGPLQRVPNLTHLRPGALGLHIYHITPQRYNCPVLRAKFPSPYFTH